MSELYTPYTASKFVNELLADLGVDKVLPPQMFYNYTTARIRAGKVPFIPLTDGKIAAEDLASWVTKYLAKQGITV